MVFSPTRRWRAAVLAAALALCAPAWTQDAASSLQQADEYARAGHFDEARSTYESAIRAGVNLESDPLRSRLLAECYVNSSPQDLGAAVRWYRAALRHEDSSGVRAELAETLMRAGSYDAAAEEYQQLASAQPESSPYWISLSGALLRGGKPEAALKALRSALDHVSSQTVIRLEYARVLAYQKQFTAAREQYEAVLRTEPGNLIAQVGVAKVTSWQGDQESALAMYDRILQRSPSNYDAQVGRAFTLLWMGRQQEAVSILESAARRHPEDADVRQALERLHPGTSRNPEAGRPISPITFRPPLPPLPPPVVIAAAPASPERSAPVRVAETIPAAHGTKAKAAAASKPHSPVHAALAEAADKWASDMTPPAPAPPERIPTPWKIAGAVAAALALMQLVVIARRPRIVIQTVREVPAWERRMETYKTRGALNGTVSAPVIIDVPGVTPPGAPSAVGSRVSADSPEDQPVVEPENPRSVEAAVVEPAPIEEVSVVATEGAAPAEEQVVATDSIATEESATPLPTSSVSWEDGASGAREDEAQAAVIEGESEEPVMEGPLSGVRILVIGAQAAVVEMQRRVLTGAGAEVVTDDHLSAEARQSFGEYNLIALNDNTSDHMRPQTVYRWVAERRPEWLPKVLIIFSAEDDASRLFAESCRARCVFQPFGAAELLKHVGDTLAAAPTVHPPLVDTRMASSV